MTRAFPGADYKNDDGDAAVDKFDDTKDLFVDNISAAVEGQNWGRLWLKSGMEKTTFGVNFKMTSHGNVF